MDIMKSLQSVIDTLQQITIQATYGNVSKMGGVLEELVKISDAVKRQSSQQAENKQPGSDGLGG